ncbi:MAG: hypothetical protein HQK83_10975 [Fibrobacteria bacterium]|nr:hypothetical protein [Fibrobacteria bacterium]
MKNFNKKTIRTFFALMLAVLLVTMGNTAAAATKIMCLGNSISEGSNTSNTYRSHLYFTLVNAGYEVDFVGDNSGTCGNRNAGESDGWDDDHNCYYSARAAEILSGDMPVNSCSPAGDGNIHDWAPKYQADIAIIHLGTNDCRGGASPENIQGSLEGIIAELRKAVPGVKIIVSKIITSRKSDVNVRVEAFNNSLTNWVSTVTTNSSPVVLIDQQEGWNTTSHLKDDYHPNEAGAKIMADKYYPAVKDFLDGSSPEPVEPGPLTIGAVKSLESGKQPFCALGKDLSLHIVYQSSGIKYMKVSPEGEISDKYTVSSTDGDNPWLAVDYKGDIHVVWDTYTKSHYRKKESGSWKSVVDLPQPRTDRHWMPQVAVDSNGVAHWSLWAIHNASNNKENASYYGIIEGNAAVEIYGPAGAHRPPTVIGTDDINGGDGKVHYVAGGNLETGEFVNKEAQNKSTLPIVAAMDAEGLHGVWMGKELVVANAAIKDQAKTKFSIEIRKFSDKANPTSMDVGVEWTFPRIAFDPKAKLVYILYWDMGDKAKLRTWDPATKDVSSAINVATVTTGIGNFDNDKGRGPGGGGIAPTGMGGVYVVYSEGNMLKYTVIGNMDTTTTFLKQHRQNIRGEIINTVYDPIQSSVKITAPDISIAAIRHIEIFDTKGLQVNNPDINQSSISDEFNWNVSNMAPGVYFISLKGSQRATMVSIYK